VLVAIPRVLPEDAAALELELYLGIWQALHWDAHATRLAI
jgi:hypothetical protein